MFEGLVKQLRYCATHDCHHEGEELVGCTAPYYDEYEGITTCNDALEMKAADAIESLTEDNEALNGTVSNLLQQIYDLSQPKWIPVSEKKPPLPVNENICWVQVIAAIKGKKEAEPVIYCRAYRYRDGKRERIERFVGDGEVVEVTHWLPMPELPKGET